MRGGRDVLRFIVNALIALVLAAALFAALIWLVGGIPDAHHEPLSAPVVQL